MKQADARKMEWEALCERVRRFDHFYEFSDDHSVWTNGNAALARLKADIRNYGPSREEAAAFLEAYGKEHDADYLAARAKYTNIAKERLWDEGDGPLIKQAILNYFPENVVPR